MMERVREFCFPVMATKREKRLNVAMVFATPFMFASMFAAFIWEDHFTVLIAIFIASVGVVGGLHLALKAAHRAALDHLREIEFLLCPACQSDLQASSTAGRCPSCGRPFKADSISIEWIERYERLLKRIEPENEGGAEL